MFREFVNYVEEHILSGWKEGAGVQTEVIRKNNGRILCGLLIREDEKEIVPTIYLNPYYKRYQSGVPMDQILEDIRREYVVSLAQMPEKIPDVRSYEDIESRIVYRLVNYRRNEELLKGCPFIRLYDLALTFRWVSECGEDGISSALIRNEELELWNKSMKEILLTARQNTESMFPPVLFSMDDMIEDLMKEYEMPCPPAMTDGSMYILTNESKINGATVVLYEGLLCSIARQFGEGFYLVPSSIHEMILLPESAVSKPYGLTEILHDGNRNSEIVSQEEVLSDSVYYYDMALDRLAVIGE